MISVFWNVTECNLVKVNRSFGGTSPPSSGLMLVCSSEMSGDPVADYTMPHKLVLLISIRWGN
jgi:hypothetical protein